MTHVCLILGVLAILAAAISPAAMRYDTLHFDRMTREIRIETRPWVRNPMSHPPPPSTVEEDTIETSLLRLRRRWISVRRIDPSVLTVEYRGGSGSAIAAIGTRALIANRFGQFYEVDLDSAAGTVRRLPLTLATNSDALRTFVSHEEGERDRRVDTVGNRNGGVTDLLFLDEGRELAAAYTYFDPQTHAVTTRVAVVTVTPDWQPGGRWRVVFESHPAISVSEDYNFRSEQAGGRLVAIDGHRLCLTVGDFGYDGVVHDRNFPQDPAASYGKIIEINLDTLDHHIVASGLRNPQGLMRDHEGRLWSTEHGPRGGDELNLIQPGKNYGWPYVTLGTDYGTHSWPLARQQGRHAGYEAPVHAWLPSIGVSNLIQLRNFAPEWDGDFLVLSLIGQKLSRLRMSGATAQYEEAIPMGASLRDVAQLADGRVVLWTDDGRMAVMSVDREPSALEQLLNGSRYSVRSIVRDCAECHTLANDVSERNRISLSRVYGRRFATGASSTLYSEALRNAAGTWDDETLNAFLRDPQALVPGTTMRFVGIRDDTARAQTIELLKSLR